MKHKPKCPKCKGAPSTFTEEWIGHGIEFQVFDGVLSRVGNMEPGEPFQVWAACGECGNGWKLRSVQQITDIERFYQIED